MGWDLKLMHNGFSIKYIIVLGLLLGLSFAPASATMAAPEQTEPDYTIIAAEGLGKAVGMIEGNLKLAWPESEGRRMDFKEPEAQKIIQSMDIKTLPFVYFKEGSEGQKGFALLAKKGIIEGKGKLYFLTDEAATAFGSMRLDAERIPERLEVFTESLSPSGQQALKSLIDRIRSEGLKIDLKIRYITKFRKYGIDSKYGDDEIDEDINQLIIQKYYPDKFFSYILARPGSTFKKAAQKLSLDERLISGKKDEGRRLLEEDARRAETFGVSTAPTFIFEGRSIYLSPDDLPFAKAEGPEAKPGTSQGADILFFFDTACRDCREINNRLLPEIKEKYGYSVNIFYYDTGDPESYNKMIELELKHGVLKKGKTPQIYIYPGGHALIGKAAIEQDIDGLLEKTIEGGN